MSARPSSHFEPDERVLVSTPTASGSSSWRPSRNPTLVPQAVFTALGLQDHSSSWAVSTLSDYLVDKRPLLILDNCEHVHDAAAVLAGTLLRTCPDVRILATSRQALGVTGEVVIDVPTLSLPEDGDASPESPPPIGRGGVVRGTRERRPAGFHRGRRECDGGAERMHPPRRHPARPRAGRGPPQVPRPGRTGSWTQCPARGVGHRRPERVASAADPRSRDRLELSAPE